MKAEISDGNSTIGTMVMQLKRPKGIRVDAALGPQAADDGHRSETKVWDGISGWQTTGDSPAQTLTVWPGPYAVDVDVIESAVGGLQYLQSPGRELTLIGRKDYWLSGHFAIQVKGRGPEVVTYYVHPESYLVTGAITEIPGPNPRTVETLFSDYRDVAGVKLAFSMEVREAGGTLQRSRFVSVEPNAFIDDGVFVNAQTAVSPQSVVGRAASRVPVGSPASLQDQKRSTAMAVSERILHETDGSLTRLGLAKGSVAGGWMLDGRDVSAPVFAADNASFAYVKAGGNGLVAVMNGVPGQAYGYLRQSEFRLSPDGVRLAYVAGRGNRRFVVVDGTEGQSWDEVGRLLFSPDSRHLLYVAKSAGKHVILLDGRILGEPADSFAEGTFAFSPDSSHIAYVVINGGKGTVMVDGAAVSKAGDRPSGDAPVFSPDSRRLAYRAGTGARALVVCDGVEGKLYDGVSKPTFSPDSKQVAHLAQDASGVFVVLKGEEKRSVTPKGEPVFSPDSGHVGWIGGRGGRVFAVIDDKEDPPYDDAGFLKWSADSGQYAYHALTGRAHVIVVGKTPGKPAVGVTEIVASPTGRRFGYAAMRSDGKWVVVVDGVESEAFDSVREGSPVFSPDAQHVAFAAERDGKWHLVVDGTPSRAYDGEFVGAPVFAGSEVRGIAKDGNKYVQVLVSLKG